MSSKPRRVLVCGGRDFKDYEFVSFVLGSMLKNPSWRGMILCHGGAKGGDSLAGEWAQKHNVLTVVFPADWKRYGRSAGPIRNQEMLDEFEPDVVVAFPGGRGTADMIDRALKAGVLVYRHDMDFYNFWLKWVKPVSEGG